jgi:hypothetical protein
MDWKLILGSATTTGILLAIAAYVMKHTFEKILDTRLKEIEERHKASIAENIRRSGMVFDQQLTALKQAVELIYATRNMARAAAQGELSHKGLDRAHDALLSNYRRVEQLLFSERAILPATIFRELHALKHLSFQLCSVLERPDKYDLDPVTLYARIDKSFNEILRNVQSHFNVAEADSEKRPVF